MIGISVVVLGVFFVYTVVFDKMLDKMLKDTEETTEKARS